MWVEACVTQENAEVYCKIYDLGIDSYCTDYPLKVQLVWDNYRRLLQSVSTPDEKNKLIARLKATNYAEVLADGHSDSQTKVGTADTGLSFEMSPFNSHTAE